MNLNEAIKIIGSDLGLPSKMPGFSFGLPAKACITGAKLHSISGTVCRSCYALRGQYTFPHVQNAQYRRLENLTNPQWIEAMLFLIDRKYSTKGKNKNSGIDIDTNYFRWHDSGDLQSTQHLENIAEIARQRKQIKFWLPTRENQIVKNWILEGGKRPKNLIIRLSAHFVNMAPPMRLAKELGVLTSGVHSKGFMLSNGVKECQAYLNNNHCGDCRNCWNPKIKAISYPKH